MPAAEETPGGPDPTGEAVPVEGGGGDTGEEAEAAAASGGVAEEEEDSDVAAWRDTGDMAGKYVVPRDLMRLCPAAPGTRPRPRDALHDPVS
jgi:hypothetical protein